MAGLDIVAARCRRPAADRRWRATWGRWRIPVNVVTHPANGRRARHADLINRFFAGRAIRDGGRGWRRPPRSYHLARQAVETGATVVINRRHFAERFGRQMRMGVGTGRGGVEAGTFNARGLDAAPHRRQAALSTPEQPGASGRCSIQTAHQPDAAPVPPRPRHVTTSLAVAVPWQAPGQAQLTAAPAESAAARLREPVTTPSRTSPRISADSRAACSATRPPNLTRWSEAGPERWDTTRKKLLSRTAEASPGPGRQVTVSAPPGDAATPSSCSP